MYLGQSRSPLLLHPSPTRGTVAQSKDTEKRREGEREGKRTQRDLEMERETRRWGEREIRDLEGRGTHRSLWLSPVQPGRIYVTRAGAWP